MESGNYSGSLYDFFIQLTGLKEDDVKEELEYYFDKLQINKASATTEDIRRLMLSYLNDIEMEKSRGFEHKSSLCHADLRFKTKSIKAEA